MSFTAADKRARLVEIVKERSFQEGPEMKLASGKTSRGVEEQSGQWVRLVVRDSGPGIPPEHLEDIFEPFFTTKPIGEGTGLGLTVTYGIINHYQGSIHLETRTEEEDPENHGTSFTVTLPVYHSKREAERAEKKGA